VTILLSDDGLFLVTQNLPGW